MTAAKLPSSRITGFDLDRPIRDLVRAAHEQRGEFPRGFIAASIGINKDDPDTCVIVISGAGASATVERARVLFSGGLL